MASKISGLSELTTPANDDQIEIVDKSDTSISPTGRNKWISKPNLIRLTVAIKTTDYTTTDDDDVLFLNAATDKTLSLIAGASRGVGRPYYVKNINSGVWAIDPNGAETIDGAATLNLAERDKAIIHWTGTAWETF